VKTGLFVGYETVYAYVNAVPVGARVVEWVGESERSAFVVAVKNAVVLLRPVWD
jgi:hypothetical protein